VKVTINKPFPALNYNSLGPEKLARVCEILADFASNRSKNRPHPLGIGFSSRKYIRVTMRTLSVVLTGAA